MTTAQDTPGTDNEPTGLSVHDPERSEALELGERLLGLISGRYARVRDWHMRDVAERRVGREAAWLFVVLQAFAWESMPGQASRWCFASDATLSQLSGTSQRSVRGHLEQLVRAGWVEVQVVATAKGRGRKVRLLQRDNGVGGPATGRGGSGNPLQGSGNRLPEKIPLKNPLEEETPPSPPDGGASPADASQEAKPRKARKASSDPPAWARELAARLDAVYPHGVTETGRVRRKAPSYVARRLLGLFRGMGGPGSDPHEALARRMVRAAEAEGKARPAGSDERRFSPGLDVWLNQNSWEVEPEHVAAKASTVYTGSEPWKPKGPDPEMLAMEARLSERAGQLGRAPKREGDSSAAPVGGSVARVLEAAAMATDPERAKTAEVVTDRDAKPDNLLVPAPAVEGDPRLAELWPRVWEEAELPRVVRALLARARIEWEDYPLGETREDIPRVVRGRVWGLTDLGWGEVEKRAREIGRAWLAVLADPLRVEVRLSRGEEATGA